MAKKYNSRKNEKTDGEQKTNGIAAMFDKLVEYAKIIESSDWKMGWKTNLNAWRGMPQNISGREYTGGNSFYLMLATMANNYTMPVYATFNQINKLNEKLMDDKGRIPKDKWAQAVHVKKGEQSDYAIFTTIQYKNKENPKEKALTREQYLQLPKEEQEKYEEKWINYAHPIFNVDQTNMSEVRPELYEKLKERMGIEQRQNFLQDTEGMYAEPAIDYILQNQTWRCPVNFTQESRGAFYSPGMDQITIPMKEQFNVPYEQKDLEKDVEKLVKPALTAKPAIENFSDADRNLSLLKENNNKEYKTELRATLMLENTFGMQLGILRQDGQSLNDYAHQIDKAIKDNPENIIAIKNQEAKIVGGKDFYATFIHEGAHSMGKELNINLYETGDKKGYAREELRAESSAGIIAATMGYGNSILFNSAAYIRGWNETASVGEKTKQMKQLQIDINSTVKRMGEMIDDAAIKAGVQPIFDKSFAEKQKTNQTTQTPAQTPADLQSVGNKVGDLQSPSQTTEPKVSQQTTAQPTQNEQTVVPSVAVTQRQNEQATQPMASNNNAKSQSADELTPRQKLEAIGYPYSSQKSEDGTFNIPTVNESLYWRYAAGIISLHEAAQEFTKNGWTNFVDEDYTRKQFAEINQKWHKLDDDLQPLAPEQTKNTAKQYAPLEDDPKMSLAEPISGQYSSSPSPKADGQSSAVEQQQNLSPAEQPIASNDKTATQSLLQQAEDFKETTGIQLEIQGDKLVHNGDLDLSKTNIERLPNNLTVKGSLDISDTPIKELPKNLTVENGLWLENTKIERLPEDLTVESTLSLYNTPVKELPENLTVKGNLWLDDSDIQRLPENFKVNGFLDLSNTPIKELPQNLTVEGSLVIYNTAIKELPDNLSVGGNIYMNGRTIEANSDILTKDGYIDLVKAGAPIQQTDAPSVAPEQQQNLSPAEQPITSITSMASIDNKTSQSLLQQAEEFQKATGIQLEVQGGRLVYDKTLDLRNTSIKELPENLTVKGNLNLAETPIKELPKDLSVGGSLWLANTNVDKLPENLTVGGDLNLSHTPIKELPDGLSVGGSLALSKTEIEELPKDLSVGGGLYLNNTHIKSLPDNLTVNGSLWLDDNPNIERLPNNLTVKGDLDLNGTNIKELPDNLTVDGGLWIQYSKIEKLPDNLTVGGSLYIKEEQAEEIPNNLKVGGPLVVDGNEISVKPDVLTPDGYLDLEKAIGQEKNEQEDVWHKLSALLMNTNEDIHLVAKEDDILVLETGEEVGLSDLEKIQLSEVWRNPSDESIHYKTRSDDEEYDLSNNTVFIRQIYNYVADGEMMMKDIAEEQQIDHTAEQQNAQPMDPIDNNNNQQTQDAKYVPVDNLANENDQYAVVKSHDGRGGYEHQIMSYQEAEEIVENRPFHYIEWSGDMQQLLKDADKVTFEDHLEVNHEEPRDYPVTLAELAIEKDIIKDKLEDTWHKLSALLMDTSEDIHLITKENDILVLETNQDMGLSDLEKNRLSEVWQHPTEGYITFKLEGSDQEFDLSEYPELIPQIYNHVADGEMIMKDVAAEQQVSQNIDQAADQKAVPYVAVTQQQNLSPADTLQQQIADFKEATGIQLEVRDGKPFYNNDLNLYGVNIEKLPDNLTVKGNLGLDSTLIKELAENLKVSGNLNLNGTQIERLPDGLSVRGSLYLEFSKIERLPENLTVGEHLDLRNTPIKQLPDNLTVGGWLDLRETPITELPNNLSVRGDLYLNDTKIKQLPENLTIKGDLWLNNTNIERLPENLTVEGNLHLANTPIKELPDNLTVKGSLDISDTNITKLPENLTVNGSLNLENTPIKELPENLTIKGYLDLDGSQIKQLPENFTVEGNLYLSKTQIERLPENLTVGGSLWLNETNIESLPENLAVKGDLRLENTNIQKLPENLTVEKNLSLKNTQVEQLPENLSVRGWLDLTNTPVKELPENLSVGGSLLLGNTNIKELQNNLTFKGNLDLENTPIKELPDNLTVGGSLWLNGTNIEKLPENLAVNGNLDLGDTPIKELPDNLTVNGDLDLDGSSIKKLPENLTVEGRLDLINTSVTELPADLKVKDAIRMDDRIIKATPDVMSPDGYIDLVKAGAPIQKSDQQTEQSIASVNSMASINNDKAASQKADSPSMEESPTAKEYTIMWMTSIAEKTPKDRPSDIVFVKDFSLEDPTKPIYEVYGKDADRLAEKISSSVVTMRPEIEGQRYPNATVNSGNIEAVRADLMINNIHPVIIDLEGNRITNDKTLDYTKEERKAFLDSLKPETKQRQDIAETIQRLGNPDKIVVPQLYNSHSVYAGPELAVPHRFGYQEVPVLQLVKSKNGSYRAGNDEDGYYPIAKMDTNNLYEVQKALKIVENNRPQKLIEELQKQVESGKASVEKDLAENHYKFTIYDQQGDLYYPRGNKSFTLNTKENDKIYLHPDYGNYVTEHKVDPQLVKKMTAYAESKLGIQQNQDNGMAVATAQQQKGPDQKNQAQDTTTSQQQSPKDNVQKTQQQNASAQQPKQGEKDAVKLTDLEVVGRQNKYFISVKANGVSLPTKQISIDDFKDFKTKKIDEQQLVNKYYSKELSPKQEQSQSHKRGR